MSIAHRPFSAGLGTDRHTSRTPKTNRWGWGHSEKSESETNERQGSMTSYPWEGLYLEVNETTVSAGTAAPQPNARLGLFLTSLMYGE
ncbi:hypothetical protein AB0N24_27085 [Arthrobacter sp. NPDC093128]|uniref:hypothetical protein n=1 Tax=Arthrobacter sp. NPDC093128 TaxID=3154979 RepID=UPI0034396B62